MGESSYSQPRANQQSTNSLESVKWGRNMNGIELSICIVNYEARDFLRECLLSLPDACPGLSWEVIVVDNGSRDGSVAMLREEFPYARVIENPGNLGYTLPMNQALKEAQGRYLIQLNPDTLVKAGAFAALAGYMEQHPQVGICTPKVLNRDGTLHRQYRALTHRPTGRHAWVGQSRKAVLAFWEEFRRYDVHHTDPQQVTAGAIAGGVLELNKKHREATR